MRLVTTPGVRTRSHSAAHSRSCSPATRTRPPGCGPVVEITAPVDDGELRWDTSERGLLTDTAAIHERAIAGDLRGRVVLRMDQPLLLLCRPWGYEVRAAASARRRPQAEAGAPSIPNRPARGVAVWSRFKSVGQVRIATMG